MQKFFALTLLAIGLAAVSGAPKPKTQASLASFGWERIVGGIEATPHEFPWMVDMRQGGHYCGASILNEDWVVTAAHCSTGSPSAYTLVAGDHNIATTDGREQSRRVTRIIRHPGYGSGVQYENDIALMKVDAPFVFNEWVQPAPLAEEGFAPTTRAIVAGWGALTEGGSSPVVLMKVDVPVVSDAQCRVAYGAGAIADSMICSGEGGKDSCQGDSGGPMMCPMGGVNYLCGIVSWGRGCARPDFPGVYTEVSYFADWTKEATQPPVESNDTWVEQREGCGGALSGSSGYVAYKLGESYGANERCVWTLQAEDREQIRIRVRSSGINGDAVLSVTNFDLMSGVTTTTTRLADLENHVFSGPVVLVTFAAGAMTGQGFDFEFYGTGYGFSTGLRYEHSHRAGGDGTASFPVGGGQYPNDAFSTIVVNPTGATNVRMTIDRIDTEGCSYDWVSVFRYANGGYQQVGTKACGSTAPTTPFDGTEGLLVAIFVSDYSVTGTGFTYSWNGSM